MKHDSSEHNRYPATVVAEVVAEAPNEDALRFIKGTLEAFSQTMRAAHIHGMIAAQVTPREDEPEDGADGAEDRDRAEPANDAS